MTYVPLFREFCEVMKRKKKEEMKWLSYEIDIFQGTQVVVG